MATKDPRIDAYIENAAEFAKPILTRFRKLVHRGCPQAVETIKWRMPFFDYKGVLCGMAAFKAHCAIIFWRDIDVKGGGNSAEGMGRFGRITSTADLPADSVLLEILRRAVAQRDHPTAKPTARRQPAKEAPVPADLKQALAREPKAAAAFHGFSPSHRREYIEWITDAKRPETRQRRLATTLEWLAAGKKQNWRYEVTASAKR
jgi:hypothetical protein